MSSTEQQLHGLDSHPDLAEIEERWRDRWERDEIYRWRPGPGEVFSVDTPPPYVSAEHLHVGHAMSYAQAEFVVRYQRMQGKPIFYPIGFDDNGLPTERFVERKYQVDKATTTRSDFRSLCLQETTGVAHVYERLWRALGLSLDWSLRYSTIDDHCRHTGQLAFVRLYRGGRIYRGDDPVFWDPQLGTALAQADLESMERTTWLYDVAFRSGAGDALVISTTRPELLAACVALYCHPDDSRYARLAGREATTPLFGHQVPVLTDTAVDADFGTGLMMVCTFGDAEDVRRWRDDRLETRLCLDDRGRFTEAAGAYAGMTVEQARVRVAADLQEQGLLTGKRRIRQRVAVSERSGAPVEFIMRPQWFLRILDLKDELRRRGAGLEWHPDWMSRRLDDWITGLRYDWNLSRQRYYGVPFPLWLCDRCGAVQLADADQLPLDPLEADPPDERCTCGGSFRGDPDVMDTWMTSSLTPQILTNWAGTPGRPQLDQLPMSLRVQAHDIIRSWLFYTLTQTHLHQDASPWKHVMISGWGLDEQGKRISKRHLDASGPEASNRYDPHAVIARHGADALRHWAARGTLGHDVRYNERDVKAGRKHVIKLWNVARFCEPHAEPGSLTHLATPEDRWLLTLVNTATSAATTAFDAYDYAGARQAADDLLWAFADDWLELTKERFQKRDVHPAAGVLSATTTMHHALRQLLGLYAPFLPFVTEELYRHLYARHEPSPSVHLTRWPTPTEPLAPVPEMEAILAVLRAVRATRTRGKLHQSAGFDTITVDADDPELGSMLHSVEPSILAAARARRVRFGPAGTPTDLEGLRISLTVPV